MGINMEKFNMEEQMEEMKRQEGILNDLLRRFDKEYLKELFEQGLKAGAFGLIPKNPLNYQYVYKGYYYRLIRFPAIKNIGG